MTTGTFRLVIEAPLSGLYELATAISTDQSHSIERGTDDRKALELLTAEMNAVIAQHTKELSDLQASRSSEIAGLESLCDVLRKERDAAAADRSDLIRRLEAADQAIIRRDEAIQTLEAAVKQASLTENDLLADLKSAEDKIEALESNLDEARGAVANLTKQVATERDLASFKNELLAPVAPQPESEPAKAAAESIVAPPASPELPIPVNLEGKRLNVLRFIWETKPTREAFATEFGLQNVQQQDRLLHTVRQAVGHKYRIQTSGGIITAVPIEPQDPSGPAHDTGPQVEMPPAPAPTPERRVIPISKPAKSEAPAKPASGTLVRVSIPLLTMTSAKGSAKVTSSLFGKVMQHMADGGLYGLDKLKQVGGYASEEAVKTAFLSHKPTLERIGLFVEISAVGARLKVR